MKKMIAVAMAAALGLALLPSPAADATGSRPAAGAAVIASATGEMTVAGETLVVDMLVLVSDAQHAPEQAQAVLLRHYPNAAPLGTRARGGQTGYTVNGMNWTTFPVVVNYNETGAPLAGALTDLTAAMATWTDVPTSSFAFAYGAATSRCPSLVAECPGTQVSDGHNDVGWLDIADSSILAITWWNTKTLEFDMGIDNVNFRWVAGCTDNYSLQTTLLHELGHALGLGHSKDPSSVMYATYLGPRCTLGATDVQGVSALYP